MEHCHSPPPSLKTKLKQTFCLSCCFPTTRRQSSESPSSSSDDRPSLLRAPTFWMKSDLPEIKDKCRNLIGRIGGRHRRNSTSADFHYDPLSYALNFDDGSFDGGDYDESPIKSFSSRLQMSNLKSSPPLRAIQEVDNRVLPSVIVAIS
ncbi:uncharacterized protein LOC124927827 [Impatiens glandulifera]|uniref:uncharacterized protein LOC124927827 n=1 Tax=Impatiens glandulifera TaxID=253017 RepID=UPI001FB0B626|nr:uncharacterized protein LOC124927827 [Impatiens glandulifera]